MDLKVMLEYRDLKVLKVLMESLEVKGLKVMLDYRDLKVLKALKALLELKDVRVPKV